MTRRFAPLAAVFAALAMAPAPGLAHAILLDSQPVHDTATPAGARIVTLRFNSLIDRRRSRLALAGPDGHETVLATDPTAAGNLLRAQAVLTPGAWRLRWQVLALDGHITRGDVTFTVTP